MKPIDMTIGDWIISPQISISKKGNRIFHKCGYVAGYEGNRAWLLDGDRAYLSDGKCCACKIEVPGIVELAARIT